MEPVCAVNEESLGRSLVSVSTRLRMRLAVWKIRQEGCGGVISTDVVMQPAAGVDVPAT